MVTKRPNYRKKYLLKKRRNKIREQNRAAAVALAEYEKEQQRLQRERNVVLEQQKRAKPQKVRATIPPKAAKSKRRDTKFKQEEKSITQRIRLNIRHFRNHQKRKKQAPDHTPG